MNDRLQSLIEALREELLQYGGLLASLEQQQDAAITANAKELMRTIAEVHEQTHFLLGKQKQREECRRILAQELNLSDNRTISAMIRILPCAYRPMIEVLIHENNELAAKIKQRVHWNVFLMQQSIERMKQTLEAIN